MGHVLQIWDEAVGRCLPMTRNRYGNSYEAFVEAEWDAYTEHDDDEDEDDIVEQLKARACPAGLPHTGDAPEQDHGHTDCYLEGQAAAEIERLREEVETLNELIADSLPKLIERLKLLAENKKLAAWLMHPYVFAHERIIEQLDRDLEPYMGRAHGE